MRTLYKLVRMDFYKLDAMRGMLIFYIGLSVAFSLDMRTVVMGHLITFYLLLYMPMVYDEQSRGNYLLGTLPVTRKQIVRAKFLYAITVIIGLDLLVGVVSLTIFPLIPSNAGLISPVSVLPMLSLVGAVFSAIILPTVLYFGVTKARYMVIGIYVLGCGSVGAMNGILREVPQAIPIPVSGLSALLLTLAILALSYLIAVKLFEKREFTE